MTELIESSVNIISESSKIEGRIELRDVSRVHGQLVGEVFCPKGSTLILSETSLVEGNIQGDMIMIDGYVKGQIVASTKVVLSSTARVFGNIHTPSLQIEFGAYFEGTTLMDQKALFDTLDSSGQTQ